MLAEGVPRRHTPSLPPPPSLQEMFRWVEEVTGTKVRSSRDFCDGTVLAALVQGLVDRASWEEHFRGAWSTTENYFTLDELPHATRLERAFEAWRRLYGVPEFLSAEAVAEDQAINMLATWPRMTWR